MIRSLVCESCVYGRGPKAEWCLEHSKYGDLAIGDMLTVPDGDRRSSATITEYWHGAWKCRVHPYMLGPDAGWFDAADVQRWRDEYWDSLKVAGITPQMMAEAMFPENWR